MKIFCPLFGSMGAAVAVGVCWKVSVVQTLFRGPCRAISSSMTVTVTVGTTVGVYFVVGAAANGGLTGPKTVIVWPGVAAIVVGMCVVTVEVGMRKVLVTMAVRE